MENNRERQRRERRAQRQRRVSRLKKILLLVELLLLICICLFLYNTISRPSSPSEESASNQEGVEDLDQAEQQEPDITEEPKATPALELISLSEEQLHSGDLILVNSDHPYDFDANATTVNLVNIKENQSVSYPVDKEEFEVSQHILPALDQMIAACGEGIGYADTSITSAYRSEAYQQELWDETESEYGLDYTTQYVSVPGNSEHHTGLAVDLGITDPAGTIGSFSESNNAIWMDEHAWEYGFVRRYREDKTAVTGISNESWHFRYVGYPHAKYMEENNLALEEYIVYLQTETSEALPLEITDDTGKWQIFYTSSSEIVKPTEDYTVSGDNISGYIITLTLN